MFLDEKDQEVNMFTNNIRDLKALKSCISLKLSTIYSKNFDSSKVYLCYDDDEGDTIHICTDRDLEDAVIMARSLEWNSLVVRLSTEKMNQFSQLTMIKKSRSINFQFAWQSGYSSADIAAASLIGLGFAYYLRRLLY
jgi:hypothetical protein